MFKLWCERGIISRVLHFDKTTGEDMREMYKTRAADECFVHFSSVVKYLECFITV